MSTGACSETSSMRNRMSAAFDSATEALADASERSELISLRKRDSSLASRAISELRVRAEHDERACDAARSPAAPQAVRSRTISPIATPTDGELPRLLNTPNGRF